MPTSENLNMRQSCYTLDMNALYEIELTPINKQKLSMSAYKNKVILLVNLASKCGFTPQYKELQELYEKYKDQGFVILGFPCNQFKNQEPQSEEKILEFCQITYGVSFPLFEKVDVNGENTHPLYRYAKSKQKGIFGTEAIKWNFTKFLINKKGEVIERFAPSTSPKSLEKVIEKYL